MTLRPRCNRHLARFTSAGAFFGAIAALWVPTSAVARSPGHPALLCRGSTRAHVRIRWPSASELAAVQRLRWGARMPHSIRRWGYLIVPQARGAGLDTYLVAGVMRVESNGDPLAWNLDSDARGFMQVLHAPFEPVTNLRLGVSMLAGFVRSFRTRDLALAAYNAGPGAVHRYHGIPPYSETRRYVPAVLGYQKLVEA